MTHVGAVVLDDLHAYKAKIKDELGGDAGISELLRAERHNFDFWVAKDGTIYISDNGEGGKGGEETELNFYTLFPEFAPEEVEVDAQPDRGNIDDIEDDDQPQLGDFYDGEDGNQYYVSKVDGLPYLVHTDERGNTYIMDATGTSLWVPEED